MKLIQKITLIFLFAFFTTNLFPQLISEKEKTIDSLFTMVKEITPENKIDKSLGKLVINDNDLEKANKLLYNAYAVSPLEYEKKLDDWVQQWGNSIKTDASVINTTSPGKRIGLLKRTLAQMYGTDYVRFLETPYFLVVKILAINSSNYKSYTKNMQNLPKIDLKAEIIDIIKGNDFYKKGDIITISYLPLWYTDCNCPVKFEIDSVYAIPLKPWYYKHNKDNKDLMIKNNGMEFFYKVDNNKVTQPFLTNSNYIISLENFISDFKKRYLINMGGK